MWRLIGNTCLGNSHNQELAGLLPHYGVPPNTPTTPRNAWSLKRRRGVTLEDSSPSKASRYAARDSIKLDSEGFELLHPSEPKTPDTVEIFPSHMTTPALGSPEKSYSTSEAESWETNNAQTAVVPGGVGMSEANTAPSSAGGSSQDQGETTTIPTSTLDAHVQEKLLDNDEPISNAPSWPSPVPSDEPLQEISPRAFEYFRNLGQKSPGTAPPKPRDFPPVSFIPATSPPGPRDLAPGHYNCPVPGCPDRFGQLGRAQGYFWANLGPHIYVAHGGVCAVDSVRLQVRRRVMALRCSLRQEMGALPVPCDWTDRSQLHSASWDLASDLEELRGWEQSRRVDVSQMRADVPMGVTSAGLEGEPAPQLQQDPEASESPEPEKKGKGKVVASRKVDVVTPRKIAVYNERNLRRDESAGMSEQGVVVDDLGTSSRANRFVRERDNRFCRPRGVSLMHTKETMRSPPKKSTVAATSARRVDILRGKDRGKAWLGNSEKENRKPVDDAESMKVD